MLTVDTATNAFERRAGSFEDDGFKIGQKIRVSGFSTPGNNGEFHVTAVTPTALSVAETLVAGDATGSAANGDERIEVFVPFNAPATINVDAGTNSFIRTSGSFRDDGFVVDQRFAAYGFASNQGDYLVQSISPDGMTLTVHQDLTVSETGSGDEQLVAQGDRGKLLNAVLAMRDKVELLALAEGPFVDLGPIAGNLLDNLTGGASPLPAAQSLLQGYLHNWVKEINEGLYNWGEVGLALTKALFDPQARRDLQNEEAANDGPDTLGNTLRADTEASVGILDVLLHELDDPDGDGSTDDSFINKHLLPMFGLPEELGMVRFALQSFSGLVGDALAPIGILLNPIEAAIGDVKDFVVDYIKDQIEERFGFDFEVFEFLTQLNSKMDLATIEVGGNVIPIFKPGDREQLEGYMGMAGAAHNALPPEFSSPVTIAGITFTLRQEGAVCTESARIKPTHYHAGRGPDDVRVDVSAEAGCSWTAVSPASWVTVVEGSTGTGDGTVRLQIQPNSGERRSVTLTIAGQPFELQQDGEDQHSW